MQIKAIIFDFDGVIFNSEPLHLQACNQVLKPLAIQIAEDEYLQKFMGLTDKEMFLQLFSNHKLEFSPEEIQQFCVDKRAFYKTNIEQCENLNTLYNVEIFLEKYKNLIPQFAICSNATKGEIDLALPKLAGGGLKQFFSYIVSIDDVSAGKPLPYSYLLAAKLLKVDPSECLVIEDSLTGITAAKDAGMHVVALT